MALHLLRHKHRFHLNPSMIHIFSTFSSNIPSQSPSSNFFTKKPLVDSRRKYSPTRDSGDVFDRFFIRRHLREQAGLRHFALFSEETQSRVAETEQPKEDKRRRVGRPRKQKPMDETQSRVAKTEQPKEQKRRRAGRPSEQKPMDETQSRAARLSGTRRNQVAALSSSSRNALKDHPDYMCSVTHAMDVLNGLSRVKKWSPLYRASMDHLMADVAHRQAFLTFSDPEDRIRYLRYKTQKKTDRE